MHQTFSQVNDLTIDNSLPNNEQKRKEKNQVVLFDLPFLFNSFFQPGIYAMINQKTQKVYIGETTNIAARLSNHFSQLQLKQHDCKTLQKDWNRYGEIEFEFKILEIEKKKLKDQIYRLQKEKYYILKYKRNIYNSIIYKPKDRKISYQTNSISIIAYGKKFKRISEASRYFTISLSTIKLRLNDVNNFDWRYEHIRKRSATRLSRPVVFNEKYSESLSIAAACKGISEHIIRSNIKAKQNWNYFDQLSKKQQIKIINLNKQSKLFQKRSYKRGRSVQVGKNAFLSIKETSIFYQIDTHTVRKSIHSPNFPEWKWGDFVH